MVAADETELVLHIGDISYSVGYVRAAPPARLCWLVCVRARAHACFRRRRYSTHTHAHTHARTHTHTHTHAHTHARTHTRTHTRTWQLSEWDNFLAMVERAAAAKPWMTAIGNHEAGYSASFYPGPPARPP
jgi:hypothetical protein